MSYCRIAITLALVLVLLAAMSAPVGADEPTRPSNTELFYARVTDQHGQPVERATFRVRLRDDLTERVAVPDTGPDGVAYLPLDPSTCYVVEVYYHEFGTKERWWYGYIDSCTTPCHPGYCDWPGKEFRRYRSWIARVGFSPGMHLVGEPMHVDVAVRHSFENLHFDEPIRVRLVIDDDGTPPYLYEATSEPQAITPSPMLYRLVYVPPAAGHYLVRCFAESIWMENNPDPEWDCSDDSGWAWSFDVGSPSTTSSPPVLAKDTISDCESGREVAPYGRNFIENISSLY